jgi:hypothetical protein
MQKIYDTTTSLDGRARSTVTPVEMRARFNPANKQYSNGPTTISLDPTQWTTSPVVHSDGDFRNTIKSSFVSAGVR